MNFRCTHALHGPNLVFQDGTLRGKLRESIQNNFVRKMEALGQLIRYSHWRNRKYLLKEVLLNSPFTNAIKVPYAMSFKI